MRILFGLKNCPATFQRALDVILAAVERQHFLVCTNDVIVFCTFHLYHIGHEETVLKLIRDSLMPLILDECHFSWDVIGYLPYVTTPWISQ